MLISIVIPTYQRDALVSANLKEIISFASGINSRSIEVIVVVDGSSDNTVKSLNKIINANPAISIQVLEQENKGRAVAKNQGLDLANGDYIWLLDDDMRVTEDSLDAFISRAPTEMEVYIGRIVTISNGTLMEDIIRKYYEKRHKILKEKQVITDPLMISTANLFCKSELLKSHRFSENYTEYGFEDFDLALRMINNGVKICYISPAKSTQIYTHSLKAYMDNMYQEARSRISFCKAHPTYISSVLPKTNSIARKIVFSKIFTAYEKPILLARNIFLFLYGSKLNNRVRKYSFRTALFLSKYAGYSSRAKDYNELQGSK